MPHLAISALGPLEATLDGERVGGFEYNKVRALLVYLAVESDRPHRRASLATLLWPDLADRAARANLSQALTTLRRALGDRAAAPAFLLADTDTVRLDPEGRVEVDAVRFLALVRAADEHAHRSWRTCSACAARLAEAVGLYRGDFLDGFFLADSAPFEEWAQVQREHLRQRALGSLEHLVEWAEWRGLFAEAAEHARRQVALEPLLEEAHRELIRLLALNGERAAALAQVEALRRLLAAELGAELEPATAGLAERLRGDATGDLRRHGEPPFNVPAAATPLVGRDDDLRAVRDHLRDGVRALTLTGAGGIGKTRLALEAARELRYDFEDGVHVVELAPLDDPALVPAAIARTLGLKDEADLPLDASLRAHLRDKHLLLVLDNFEHLLDGEDGTASAASFAAELLAACPAVRELVTSRAPLHIRAEHLHSVSPLALPEAAELFLARAAAVRPGFAPTAADAAAIASICRRLDGLPLAIELIAARARTHATAELLAELDQGLGALAAGPRDAPERHRTLRGAIAWSVERLDASETRVLAHLGVFAGGGTADAARAVLGDEAAVEPVLEALAETSLIGIANEGGDTRFTLLETIRVFARDELRARGEEEAARNRHADYFLALAERARPLLTTGPAPGEWLDRLERDHDNLRVALARHLEARDGAALRLAIALGPYWEVRGYLGEGRRWLAAALDARPDAPAPLRARAMDEGGLLASRQGDYPSARALFGRSLALWHDLEDDLAIVRDLRMLGAVSWDEGDAAGARKHYEESLALAREIGDPPSVAGALNNLGMVARGEGDPDAACALYAASLPIFRELGDARNTGNVLLNLGLVKDELGDREAALRLLDESLAMFRSIRNRWGTALVLLNRANLDLAAGDLEAAEGRYEESLAIYRELGDRATVSYPLFGLGEAAYRRGELATARSLMTESLRLRHEAGERRPIPRNVEGLALVARAEGRAALAACLWGAAEAMREAQGRPPEEAHAEEHEREMAALRAVLGDAAVASARLEGRALSLEAVFERVVAAAG